jgi:hypothetical protein
VELSLILELSRLGRPYVLALRSRPGLIKLHCVLSFQTLEEAAHCQPSLVPTWRCHTSPGSAAHIHSGLLPFSGPLGRSWAREVCVSHQCGGTGTKPQRVPWKTHQHLHPGSHGRDSFPSQTPASL